MQARKYGLGTVVVTQRTANVTKTILNQCHTVFAMRSFDATGMEFLRNYIGADYVGTLATLRERHLVVFGRASSCPAPVMLRVNDHDEMLNGFWEEVSTTVRAPKDPEEPDGCEVDHCFGTIEWAEGVGEDVPDGGVGQCGSCGAEYIWCADCAVKCSDDACPTCGANWFEPEDNDLSPPW